MRSHAARLVARAAACAVIGALVGVVGTVGHRASVVEGPVALGIVLALLAVLAASVLSRAWAGHPGLLGFGVGWVAVVQLLSVEGPGGDVLVPAQAVGFAWTYGGLAVVAAAAFAPRSWFSDRPVRTRGHAAHVPDAGERTGADA